jgi:phosphatidylglycerol lysyltransferase
MIDAAMRALDEDGCEYATLGLSPLSTRAQIAPFDNPFWLRILLAWLRKHAQRFYNFDGLDAFKAKLQPETWEPVFAIYNRPQISPRALYAIASVFSGNKPVRLILAGLWRAVLTEIKWLRQWFNKQLNQDSNLTRL